MNNRPIVIGAVGGSGTRVFAQILQKSDVFIGNELNGALDNLMFSRLFRIPEFYTDQLDHFTFKRLSLFEKYMTNKKPGINDLAVMFRCNKNNAYYNNSIRTYYNLLKPKPETATWGWKAPLSQLYINALSVYFPHMKYIQVVRNGLDMAFSDNVNQLRIWGHLFELEYKDNDKKLPSKLLKYWYHSNKTAIEKGREKLGKRFLTISFEDLCRYPEKEVPKLIDFLELKVTKKLLEEIITLPKIPKSHQRYKKQEHSFNNEELLLIEEIDYMVKTS